MELSLPEGLLHAVDQARRALAENPEDDLGLGFRLVIWCQLGPRPDAELHPLNPGLRRRAELALLSAEHVLPLWITARPNDGTPRELLSLCRGYLQGQVGRDAVRAGIRRSLDLFDTETLSEAGYQLEHEVINAVGRALEWAVYDTPFDLDRVDLSLTEEDVDSEDYDSAVFAAFAVAGGFPREEGVDNRKRREFWNWWLDVAVTRAWAAVEETALGYYDDRAWRLKSRLARRL